VHTDTGHVDTRRHWKYSNRGGWTMTETKPRKMRLALAALCIVGVTVAGCAGPGSVAGNQAAAQQHTAGIAAKYTVAPGELRPDGTLGNGLLPEPWGETS
jgi:hypothetical protein